MSGTGDHEKSLPGAPIDNMSCALEASKRLKSINFDEFTMLGHDGLTCIREAFNKKK